MGAVLIPFAHRFSEFSEEKGHHLLDIYQVPGTVHHFILIVCSEGGYYFFTFAGKEGKSQRLKSCPRLVVELGSENPSES